MARFSKTALKISAASASVSPPNSASGAILPAPCFGRQRVLAGIAIHLKRAGQGDFVVAVQRVNDDEPALRFLHDVLVEAGNFQARSAEQVVRRLSRIDQWPQQVEDGFHAHLPPHGRYFLERRMEQGRM